MPTNPQRLDLLDNLTKEFTRLGDSLSSLQSLSRKYTLQIKRGGPFTKEDFIGELSYLGPEDLDAAIALLQSVLSSLPQDAYDHLYAVSRA